MLRTWWFWVGTALLAAAIVVGSWGYSLATGYRDAAEAGRAALKSGVTRLSSGDPKAAIAAFEAARVSFARARTSLGPAWARSVPLVGTQLVAADGLAEVAEGGSRAAAEVAALADLVSRAPKGAGRLNAALTLGRPHLEAALVAFGSVSGVAQRLDPDGLVPPLADAVATMRRQLQSVAPLAGQGQALLEVERYLLGTSHRFVVVFQNGTELRPTGGFVGSYGLLQLGPRGLVVSGIQDVGLLARDTLNLPPPAGAVMNPKSFRFRDANWWLDFPTSASTMLRLWRSTGQPKADGIIAIDTTVLRDLLGVLGPIRVREADVPLTSANVLDELTRIVEQDQSLRFRRKNVLVSLGEALVQRLQQPRDGELLPIVQVLGRAANGRHLQVFVTDRRAESGLRELGWAGALDLSPGTNDLLAISNALVRPSKANMDVAKSVDYHVALSATGTADTVVGLGYTKGTYQVPGMLRQWFGDYVRVYRAPGTIPAPGEQPLVRDELGLPTFVRELRVDPGRSTAVVAHTIVPDALTPRGTAGWFAGQVEPSRGFGYRLLVVKQADLADWSFTTTVQAPPGWRVASATARWRGSGEAVPVSVGESSVTLAAGLREDLVVEVTLVAS